MAGIPMSERQYDDFVRSVQIREAREEQALRLVESRRVFVSYSHTDKVHRNSLLTALEQHDVKYVVDAKDINVGDEISDWAEEQIRTCSHYVLILSPESAVAPWCLLEQGLARGARCDTLIWMVNDVKLPTQLSSRIATDDLARIVAILTRETIDPGAVGRFLASVTHVPLDHLDRYEVAPGGDARWVLRDRTAVAADLRETWSHPLVVYGGSRPVEKIVLWALEAVPDGRWRLELSKGWQSPDWHELTYNRQARALVMEPPLDLDRLDVVGVRRDRDDGTWDLGPKTGSVEEALSGTRMYGWRASRDFWEAAQRELHHRLEAPPA